MLKPTPLLPFLALMQAHGVPSTHTGLEFQVAVVKKQQQSVEQQGQQALQLIQSAAAPTQSVTPAHVGSQLNLTA